VELTERTHRHLGIGKRKKTERTKGREGYGKTEFGQDAAISAEEAILSNHINHVPVTLTLSTPWMHAARSPGGHRVQVWSQSSRLSRRRSDWRKKFTDRQTDGRRAIVLAHGIS